MEMKKKMEEKLSIIEATKLLFRNINLLLSLFLCSLPLLCFLIFFELSLQTTISLTYQFLYKQISFNKDFSTKDFYELSFDITTASLPSEKHSIWKDLSENDLIPWLIHTSLLYFFPYTILDFITTNTIVAASSIAYTTEKEPLGMFYLVERSIKLGKKRVGGFMITSLYVLVLSSSVFLFFCFLFLYYFFGFFSNPTNYSIFGPVSRVTGINFDPVAVMIYALVVLVHSALFMFLTAKFTKWSAGWNMGLVVSVLEEADEDGKGVYGSDALSLSAWYRKGHEKRDLWMMLMFLVFGIAVRMPCLYSKCSESSSGNGVLYTGLYVGLICVGNVVKWVACVVCYHDCKTRFLRKKHDVEQAKPPST